MPPASPHPPGRPLFPASGHDLEKLFVDRGYDLETLRLLKDELAHRTKPKMVALRQQVDARLAAPHSQRDGTPPKPVRQPATPKLAPPPPAPRPAPPSTPATTVHPGGDGEPAPGGGTATIRARGHLAGTPPRMDFQLETDLDIAFDAKAGWAARYQAALTHLIAEVREKGSGVRMISLTDGTLASAEVGSSIYKFPFEGDEDLFEGATVTAQIGGRQAEGNVVSVIAGKSLTVALRDDFGPSIASCILRVDNTAMLEALRTRIEAVGKGDVTGFNTALADALIENAGAPQPPDRTTPMPRMKDGRALRTRQEEAVRTALSNPVFYLWGPPGTGKTFTLSALVDLLFQAGKRILICSNTNQAVDQVLLSLCSHLKATNPKLLDDGAVIRIGRIALEKLQSEFGQYVNIDGIKERKAAELQRRREALQEQLNRLDRQFASAKQLADAFRTLDQLKGALSEATAIASAARQAEADAEARERQLDRRSRELVAELKDAENASILRRILKRSADTVRADIEKNRLSFEQAREAITQARGRAAECARKEQGLKDGVVVTEAVVHGVDRRAIDQQIAVHHSLRQPIQTELNDIARKIEEIEKTAMENARIIGATVTKLYLSPKMFSNFDAVVVDEVSMVILPALYHAAGLAKEKVIVSGDPRQLPPIVQTNQQAIFDLIGRDVFDVAGIARAGAPRTVMLETQNRMAEPICRLISGDMYDDRLRTDPRNPIDGKPPPAPFSQPLTIIDTSSVAPFSNRDPAGSRYNLMNALAVRNLVHHLAEQKIVQKGGDIGVISPFAAQAKLLQKVLEQMKKEDGVTVAGTVHRFQGDERRIVVIDIPDSHGERHTGIWLQADNPDLTGAKLFNVAVTRAQDHLIFLANLRYLDKRLPGFSFLRGMLHAAQTQGRVVNVRDVLNFYPIANDLRRLGTRFTFDPKDLEEGWYNERTFGPVIEADLAAAKKSALIFSGFVTPQRVAAYEALFRRKIAEGVTIRCVTRPPSNNGSIPPADGKDALDGLEAMGCIVDTRYDTHQKAIVIDNRTVWHGSLNPLSHTTRTGEIMTRIENPAMAQQLIDFLALRGMARGDGTGMQKESRNCPNCGGRTGAKHGRHGLYFICESPGCWQGNHSGKGGPQPPISLDTNNAPPCPECGSAMKPRTGRYGEFWGCTKFPECKGIVNFRKKPGAGNAKKQAGGAKAGAKAKATA